ncbi:MAG TPA: PilC/PilY family type IV pilus protein, partial [Comamonas denitrificans]|nr:PilC/PilY family type IV pilus protein [Comamonas denitrificans]
MNAKDMVLKDPTKPYNEDSNPYTKTRTEVLQDALTEVFNDTSLLPDKKIRLAWQSLGDCTSVDGLTFTKLGTSAASSSAANTMKILDEAHRSNFIKYTENYKACASTPTHKMVKRADEYMRAPLHENGPWASIPGEELNGPNGKPLGCRRNYHILLTDGQWNGQYYGPYDTYYAVVDNDNDNNNLEETNWDEPKEDINTDPINFDNQDSKTFKAYGKKAASPAKPGENQLPDLLGIDPYEDPKDYPGFYLPDGTEYSRENKNTWIYRDIDYLTYSDWHDGYRPCRSFKKVNNKNYCADSSRGGGVISTLSDWSFKSWATRLQPKEALDGEVVQLPEYAKAHQKETFTNPITGKTATLEKYWNPRYNPATWAHMTTFTIGFSSEALPETQYRPMGNNSQTEKNIGKYWREGTTGAKNYWGSTTGLFYYLNGPYAADASESSTNNGNEGKLIQPSSTIPYGYDGSFADYASGRAQWYSVKQPAEDMWHAAINGRGQFYAVEKGEDLKKAFEQIIRTINTEVSPSITSTALSGSNISRSGVSKFTGNYEPQSGWKGFVIAETVDTDGGVTLAWGGENTANKLDALGSHTSRVILSWSDQWVNAAPKGGVPFVWAADQSNLSTSQKLALQKATNGTDEGEAAGQNRLNYIRGDRSKEGTNPSNYTESKPYRQRQSRQGDIVNSEVWYTAAPARSYAFNGYRDFIKTYKDRTPMIYVGGNDGMLHGFSAQDGTEKIAYVPQGVIPSLTRLTAPAYDQQHRYFVDGSPMTGDANTSTNPTSPDWRTLLVGTLGAGGRGYFVLDVTNPSNFSANNASSLVVLDRTRSTEVSPPDCTLESDSTIQAACTTTVTEDRDIGHITAAPVTNSTSLLHASQITMLNNNRWAVVLGNGYNSANQRPVLLVQYLDGNKELLTIPTTVDVPGTGKANDNGLSAPRLVDLNGDDRPDIAYAGDNQGNMWKFDLTSYDASEWGVAFSGEPLFTAQRPAVYGSSGTELPQPITVAPTTRANDRKKCELDSATQECKPGTSTAVGGMMVAFGTGRNVARNDPESTNVHTLYSVLDNTRYRYIKDSNPKRLEIHPDKACQTSDGPKCINVPAPAPLGAGVDAAKLKKQTTTVVSGS